VEEHEWEEEWKGKWEKENNCLGGGIRKIVEDEEEKENGCGRQSPELPDSAVPCQMLMVPNYSEPGGGSSRLFLRI
jgi:hypothetical protein